MKGMKNIINLIKRWKFFLYRYGLKHSSLLSEEPGFWRFTFHHFGMVNINKLSTAFFIYKINRFYKFFLFSHGKYDVAASIKKIWGTRRQKIIYIGTAYKIVFLFESIIRVSLLLCPVPSQTMFKKRGTLFRTLYGLHFLPGFGRHEAGGKRIT
jgi:hypothetical protein